MDDTAELANTFSIPVDNDETNREQGFYSNFRYYVQKYGLGKGSLMAIKESGGVLSREMSENTQRALSSGPVLVLVTHDTSYEVISACAGLGDGNKPRQDIKFIAEASDNPDDWMNDYMFPVYNAKLEGSRGLLRRVNRSLNPPNIIPPEEALSKNAVSMRRAWEYLSRHSGIVVYCPEGTRPKGDDWYDNGVGGMLRLFKHRSKKLEDNPLKIIFCNVTGAGYAAYMRYRINQMFGSSTPFRRVRVKYSEPINISDIDIDRSYTEITHDVQNRYRKWLKENA